MDFAPYIPDDDLVFTDSEPQGSDNREVLPHPNHIILSEYIVMLYVILMINKVLL